MINQLCCGGLRALGDDDNDPTQLRSAVQRCCERYPALLTVQQEENTTTKWTQSLLAALNTLHHGILSSIDPYSQWSHWKLSEATQVSPKVPQVLAKFEHCMSSPHHHMKLPASFEQAFRALQVKPASPQNLPQTQEQAIAVVQCCTHHHLPQTKVTESARM